MEEIRKAGKKSELEIQFQRLQIDKTNRVISSPISPRTAAALEGMTTLMGDWSTLSESDFRSHLERGEGEEEELSSTLKRTILLELIEKKKKETGESDMIEGEGTEERALDDGDEEEEKHQSEAKTLPTTEVSSSATSAEEDIEVLTITGLTGTGTEDDPEVDEIERLEFEADPMGEADGTGLVSTLELGPTKIAGLTRPMAQRQICFQTDEEPEEALAKEAKRAVTRRKVQGQKTKEGERSSSDRRGRARTNTKNDREEEMRVIREMARQEQAEKRKKDRRERESSRRPPIEPVIASPRMKRPRNDDGAWIKAQTIPDRVELEKTAESGAPRAAYRGKEKPGNPSRSHPPNTGSTPRSTPWSQDNMMPTLDIFPRSILAGVTVTDLFPSMRAFRMKPNMMARYYVDDVRIVEKKEGQEDRDDENEQSDSRAGQKLRQERRGIEELREEIKRAR